MFNFLNSESLWIGTDMKKFKWLLGMLVLALMPMLQSCDDDDGYSIGDFSWDWATVRTTGGGGYYLVGDRWGIILFQSFG